MSQIRLGSIPLLLLLLQTPAVAETILGDGVVIETATAISEILADPEAWNGKVVRVEGKVRDVCPRRGCWMELSSGESVIRIKVEDGVIVFPRDAVGGTAAAQGVVEVLDLTREQYSRRIEHLAEEKGESFDPESVGEGPYLLIQIRGTGAVIGGE